MNNEIEKTSQTNFTQRYSLNMKKRIFRDKVLISFYNKKKKPTVKKFKPITVDGYRKRLNLETGEIEYYTNMLCVQSKTASVTRSRILLSELLEMNDFDYFITLTFSDNSKYAENALLDRTDDDEVYKCYQKFIHNMMVQFPLLGYICIPERHKKYDAIHFHMLLQVNGYDIRDDLGFKDSGKVCCSWAKKTINGKEIELECASVDYYNRTKDAHHEHCKETDGLPIFNITKFKYGFSTASAIVSPEACKTYVRKYITKEVGNSTNIFKKRFFYSRNLNVPEVIEREIGSGFDSPVDFKQKRNLGDLYFVNEFSKVSPDCFEQFNEEHNVLQYWLNKTAHETLMHCIKNDMLLTNEKTPFDNEQLKFI